MYLNKKQQEVLRIISFDIECLDISKKDKDNYYHFELARDNARALLKELNLKVIED